jgi:alpha-tubulin suppressor-like RCC1 family protein
MGVSALLSGAPVAAQTVSGNTSHSLAVKSDGTAWAWGANTSGQIGDGTTTRRDLPTQVSTLSGITAVAAGGNFSLALKSNGTVWAWGANSNGQLGDGTTTQRTTPVQVSTLSSIVAIAAGTSHGLALKSDGTVYGWGANGSGQVGDGTTTQRTSPVQLTTLIGITSVTSRTNHSLALKSDGTVKSWGSNGNGQLGDGSTTGRTSPVAVSTLTSVAAISTGDSHSMARKTDGTVYAWGSNVSGQLGDGTTTQRTTAVAVSSLGATASIAAGGQHSIAVFSDGAVAAWGSNGNGQLGDGTTTGSTTPISISTPSDVTVGATGQYHTMYVSTTGTVWAVGRNTSGQVGDGTLVNRLTAVKVSEASYVWKVGTPTFSVESGTYTAVQNVVVASVTAGATIRYTINGADPTEPDPTVPGNGIVTVSESLTLKARAWKSGIPESNIDGVAYTLTVATPTFSPNGGTFSLAQNVTVSTTVSGATIRYTTNGAEPTESDPTVVSGGTVSVPQSLTLKAKAWRGGWTVSDTKSANFTLKVATPQLSPSGGSYSSAQTVTVTTTTPAATLRYTTSGSEPTVNDPVVVSGNTVAIGSASTFKVKGWKAGWSDSDTTIATYTFNLGTVATPTFAPVGGTYTSGQSVALGTATSGAVIRFTLDGSDPTLSSKVYTAAIAVSTPMTIKARAFKVDWTPSTTGTASYVFDYGTVAIPTLVPPGGDYPSARPVTISTTTAGATIHYTTNGVDPTTSDPVVTSGSTVLVNKAMRLKARAVKTGVPDSAVVTGDYWITGTVSGGGAHTLALKADGTVWGWGANALGQLGDGTQTERSSPMQVSGLSDVGHISAGTIHSLALKTNGTVWAWGNNQFGRLGDGTTTMRLTPVQVSGLSDVVAIAAADSFSMALKRDGTVCAWGGNSSGQIGDGTTTQRVTPVCLTSLTGVSAIAAGGSHALALKTDGGTVGTVWSWGNSTHGQVGDGAQINRTTPLAVLANAVAVAAGFDHSLAVLADKTARAWGDNIEGRLGDGTNTDRFTPSVVRDLDGVVALAGGEDHSLARTTASSVWTWGNHQGISFLYEPYLMPGAGTAVVAASAGASHAVTARRDGSVWTWGLNLNHQLADGTTTAKSRPILVVGFSLVDAAWITTDQDGDGLATWRELEIGTNPLNPDTNDDGLLDGAADRSGESPTNPDMDGDGVSNTIERQQGTDPFRVDSDGDTVNDGSDAFPLDPTRSQAPQPTPGDTTPPIIILIYPLGAILIGG